jgi:negative regulator of sigma E activity
MTRTDVVASSRPQAADAALMRRGSSRAWRRLILPVALSLAVALMASTTAFAAETTTGYSQTPPPPTTKTTPTSTAPAPTTGTSPSKESSTPTTATTPTTTPTPTTSTSPTTAKSLPFTGFDLRWTVGIGIVLMGMGFSIVTMQRRQRRGTRR